MPMWCVLSAAWLLLLSLTCDMFAAAGTIAVAYAVRHASSCFCLPSSSGLNACTPHSPLPCPERSLLCAHPVILLLHLRMPSIPNSTHLSSRSNCCSTQHWCSCASQNAESVLSRNCPLSHCLSPPWRADHQFPHCFSGLLSAVFSATGSPHCPQSFSLCSACMVPACIPRPPSPRRPCRVCTCSQCPCTVVSRSP